MHTFYLIFRKTLHYIQTALVKLKVIVHKGMAVLSLFMPPMLFWTWVSFFVLLDTREDVLVNGGGRVGGSTH